MTKIRIHENTSTDEIRVQLSKFGWLSKVEASSAGDADKKTIVLHEVTLGKRLLRWLSQDKDQRAESVASSRRALKELADTRPALKALLGHALQHRSVWSATELHQALAANISRLPASENGGGLAVNVEGCPLGVANARAANISADSQVTWNIGPAGAQLWAVRDSKGDSSRSEVVVTHPGAPTADEMRAAYRAALTNASGHFVITPIKNLDTSSISDDSLTLLLEEIDEARNNNPKLTAITIAVAGEGENFLAGRIEDLQAVRKSAKANRPTAERGRFYPPNGHQAPGRAGIHFLTNSPFSLQAGRVIVPASVADRRGYEYVKENEASTLLPLDTGRLIGLDDRGWDQPARVGPDELASRFNALLTNVAGTVVIYPPPAESEQLEAVMRAVVAACEKNPSLSVSFAVEDKAQQASLEAAYRTVL